MIKPESFMLDEQEFPLTEPKYNAGLLRKWMNTGPTQPYAERVAADQRALDRLVVKL